MKEITSPQNQLIKKWKKLLQKKWREKENQYLIEGPHLVQEAIKQSKHTIVSVIYHPDFHAPDTWDLANLDSYVVTDQIFRQLSQTESHQGVIAICLIPPEIPYLDQGRFLLIDGVQDPGNLGTIIRTADAAGMSAVYLGDGCVDLYNHKVLRSAQGSHFHLPVMKGDLQEVIQDLRQLNIVVYGTDLNGRELPSIMPASSSYAVLVGNEGQGVSQKLLRLTNENIKIPMFGRAESLNVAVAAGILMYWLRKD